MVETTGLAMEGKDLGHCGAHFGGILLALKGRLQANYSLRAGLLLEGRLRYSRAGLSSDSQGLV
jgi:hypothetical protein